MSLSRHEALAATAKLRWEKETEPNRQSDWYRNQYPGQRRSRRDVPDQDAKSERRWFTVRQLCRNDYTMRT